MRAWRRAASLTVLGAWLHAAPASGGNDPESWLWFESRESPGGPILELARDGGTNEVRASADTVLISYLAGQAFGGLPQLSVSANDTNRVLVRFDLPEGGAPKEARLRLVAHPSGKPTRADLVVAVHVVTAPWEEGSASWSAAPDFEEEPAALLTVPPAGGAVTAAVGDAVRAAREAGGRSLSLLLKVRSPAGRPSPVADPTLAKDLVASLPFEAGVAEALEKAGRTKRPVLALVRAGFDDAAESFPETTLLACALTDPDVAPLLRERFVLARVRYEPGLHLGERADPRDPLGALGTSARETRAPALVVATAQGKSLGRLAAIGTYEPGIVRRFLLATLDKRGAAPEAKVAPGVLLMRQGRAEEARKELEASAASDAPARDEARYWLACLLGEAGDGARATGLWRALAREAPTSPFGLRARARLAWPTRMRTYEALATGPRPDPAGSTETKIPRDEVRAAVARAVAWLVAHQEEDGAWRSASGDAASELAITALVARALRRWKADVGGVEGERAARALARADARLEAEAKDADPLSANSFGTAYLLDYAVDRLAEDAGARPLAEQAVRLVAGAQCANGGWSYDRAFGTGWKGGFGGWPPTDKGRVHSMNTGLSLLALARAKAAGLEVDADVLARGRDALLAMRVKPGVYTYTFPEPRNFETPDASAARGPLCEHALRLLDAATEKDLRAAVEPFLEWRGALRSVAKLSPSWLPPHAHSSYFVFFAYHHGARAVRAAEGKRARATLAKLQDDLLACVEADGTWVDFEESGKAYGTAAVLLVLDEARR
jgi:hypothetical protein